MDETLAEAHTSLAFIKFRWDRDRVEAEREFQLAIKYKPTYAPGSSMVQLLPGRA